MNKEIKVTLKTGLKVFFIYIISSFILLNIIYFINFGYIDFEIMTRIIYFCIIGMLALLFVFLTTSIYLLLFGIIAEIIDNNKILKKLSRLLYFILAIAFYLTILSYLVYIIIKALILYF
jgi:hypothetical protein